MDCTEPVVEVGDELSVTWEDSSIVDGTVSKVKERSSEKHGSRWSQFLIPMNEEPDLMDLMVFADDCLAGFFTRSNAPMEPKGKRDSCI
jgi:precorrin-4 methylase